jgi:hypothetical protein
MARLLHYNFSWLHQKWLHCVVVRHIGYLWYSWTVTSCNSLNSSVDIILQLIQLTLLIVPDLLGCGCAHQILDSELLISKNDMNAFHFVIIELQCIVFFFLGSPFNGSRIPDSFRFTASFWCSLDYKCACLSFSLCTMSWLGSMEFSTSSSVTFQDHFGDVMDDYVHLGSKMQEVVHNIYLKKGEQKYHLCTW